MLDTDISMWTAAIFEHLCENMVVGNNQFTP